MDGGTSLTVEDYGQGLVLITFDDGTEMFCLEDDVEKWREHEREN